MRHVMLLAALLTVPALALAQPAPPQPSQQAAFAGALASNLSNALAENERLQVEVARLKAEAAKNPAPPADAPKQ